jgi:hypothetical protein
MATEELAKIVADLAKNVDKLALASQHEFAAVHDEIHSVLAQRACKRAWPKVAKELECSACKPDSKTADQIW